MKVFFHHVQNAHDSLRANRTRTFLTISGVAIGIASIIAVLSLAHGATQTITAQVDGVGGNIAVIRSGAESTSTTNLINQQTQGLTSASTLTESDLTRVAHLPSVTATAPIMIAHTTITGETSTEQTTIVGTTPELLTISNVSLQEGDFIKGDNTPIIIGSQLSIELFGTEDSLGKAVTIKGQTFSVGGIIERQQNPINFNGFDLNTAALMSPPQIRSINPATQIQQINLQTNSVATLDRTVIELNKTLLAQHSGEHDFRVLTGDAISAPTSQLFSIIAGVTAAIASISLFVGGIGIMNIMLVNVAERTREIGIRKALGASRTDILWQFLIESIIMALLGGLVGGGLGLATAFGVSLFLTFDPAVTWHMAATAIGVAGCVGILFGLYPALRAAHKHPIEALNQHT